MVTIVCSSIEKSMGLLYIFIQTPQPPFAIHLCKIACSGNGTSKPQPKSIRHSYSIWLVMRFMLDVQASIQSILTTREGIRREVFVKGDECNEADAVISRNLSDEVSVS